MLASAAARRCALGVAGAGFKEKTLRFTCTLRTPNCMASRVRTM